MAVGLDPQSLRLHKEDPKTTHKYCPGTRVSKSDIVNAVERALFIETAGEHLPDRRAGVAIPLGGTSAITRGHTHPESSPANPG
jgi:hypothetical protein